ncbi:WD40 domain protein [Talaromyces proteolyticus]|uniref:WD40 domain protein n=1 Tax=Talaromyces proteolyticus TaxID=1131652 RepID=A0AAD4KR67_9EURO|nr:WD40 domain protein [Talaromyces proteolyticus]KAH8698614.1 WD40 domain protein [Talaromyces proteolyticus]
MASQSNTGPSLISISHGGEYTVQIKKKEIWIHSAVPIEGTRFLQSSKLKEPLSTQLKFLKISGSGATSDGENKPNTTQHEEPLDLASHYRIICGSESRISVWQVDSLEWHADIENIEPSLTSVDFGASDDEAILFHAWSSKATIFNLDSAKSLVIKSPKFCNPSSQGYGYRPRTRQLAILLKPETSDLLTIHEACSYETISKVILPTIDAQGLKWSPDGRWIAIWDAANNGTKILIYTADGQLFRTYSGRPDTETTHDLGIRCIEWAPLKRRQQSSELLAVGKFDGTVDLLNTRTFSCSTTLLHTFQIDTQSPAVWRERMSFEGKLEYAEASSSSAFTTASADSAGFPRGVSMLRFSYNSDFLATVDQTQPNIVWIWSLSASINLKSALVHEHNVRNIAWHPREQELLITTANSTFAAVHVWSQDRNPNIAGVPISRSEAGRYDVTWVTATARGEPDVFWFNTADDAVLGHLSVGDDGHGYFNMLHSVSGDGYPQT